MSRDEILNMPAGRQLDALIAEKVMGWEAIRVDYFGEDSSPRQNELEEWMAKNELDSIGDYFIDVDKNFWVEDNDWQPSTDIHAAWEVVEKMRNNKYEPCVNGECWTPIEHRMGLWQADFQNGGPCHSARADTAPLAICRAALLAAMEE